MRGRCGCSLIGSHRGHTSKRRTPGGRNRVPALTRESHGHGCCQDPRRVVIRCAGCPSHPALAIEDAGVTSRISLCPARFYITPSLGTAPTPPLSRLDRLGCRELENPRPQSQAQPVDLFTRRPLSACPSGQVFALAGSREIAVFVMITGSRA